jgi:hypothetical protein
MNHYTVPDTRPLAWLTLAPCKADPEAMFPTSFGPDVERAKSFCRRCTAIDSCLQWALETGQEHGVWGGLTEGERLTMARRAVRPISIDDYTGTPKTRASTGLTLLEVWEANTLPDGEHLLWTGPKVVNRPDSKVQITPNRLSFYLDRKHWPEGDTKRECKVPGCVKPTHLTDRRERAEEADLAVAM